MLNSQTCPNTQLAGVLEGATAKLSQQLPNNIEVHVYAPTPLAIDMPASALSAALDCLAQHARYTLHNGGVLVIIGSQETLGTNNGLGAVPGSYGQIICTELQSAPNLASPAFQQPAEALTEKLQSALQGYERKISIANLGNGNCSITILMQ